VVATCTHTANGSSAVIKGPDLGVPSGQKIVLAPLNGVNGDRTPTWFVHAAKAAAAAKTKLDPSQLKSVEYFGTLWSVSVWTGSAWPSVYKKRFSRLSRLPSSHLTYLHTPSHRTYLHAAQHA
jgi:hypothetical protein